MSSGVARMQVGAVTGTGAIIEVETLDFQPRYIRLLNVGGNAQGEWVEGMADDSVQKVVDSGAGATDISLATSDGITPKANGFDIGADTDLNAAGELIHYIAFE